MYKRQVLRISGLFRDTFPNVVELVERAVLAVAGLDEPPEQNFVKKHTDQERKRLVAEGLSENEALEQASLRVFGCPPGTYGCLLYTSFGSVRRMVSSCCVCCMGIPPS